MVPKIREEQQILMSYEEWLGSNILGIDRAYNRGDFIGAHLGILTLFSNMLAKDRKGLREFIEKNAGDYPEIKPHDVDDYLMPSGPSALEAKIAGEWHIPEWRTIYMAMIDYFHSRGYLFKTRTIELGDEHDVGASPEDSEGP
jgi:hypothetical protein